MKETTCKVATRRLHTNAILAALLAFTDFLPSNYITTYSVLHLLGRIVFVHDGLAPPCQGVRLGSSVGRR